MKALILASVVVSVLFASAITYAANVEDFLLISDEFHGQQLTAEIVSNGGISPAIDVKDSSCAISGDGSIFLVETWGGVDQIYVFDKDHNYYHGGMMFAQNGYKIKAIDFDNFGNMYCVLNKVVQNTYSPGTTTLLVTIKISGFDSLQNQFDELANRIDNIELTQGPQGPQGPAGPQGEPGITPAEVAAMQAQIKVLQQQNKNLQDLVNRIASFPPVKLWLRLKR